MSSYALFCSSPSQLGFGPRGKSRFCASRTLKTEQCDFILFCKLACMFFSSLNLTAVCLITFTSSSSILPFRSSPRLISTGQLHTLLCFHPRPINDVVYIEPYSIKDERSYLRVSFTLRCFQRLSLPDVATQLCPWQDNWCTRGLSIPVLSY